MRTIELIGDIDGQHRLHARVPTEISAGRAPRVMVFLPEEDEAGLVVSGPTEWPPSGRQTWPILGKTSTRSMTITA
jgi:hypothetical protein